MLHRRHVPGLVVVASVAALVAATSGGAAGLDRTDPGHALIDAPAATPTVTTLTVDTRLWFAGFRVLVETVTAEVTLGSGGVVTLDASFKNYGPDAASFSGTVRLDSAGTSYEADDVLTDLPSVPPEGTGKGTLGFRVDDDFTFDDAVLTIGLPASHQAVLPLGSSGTLVTLEPIGVPISGAGTAGVLRLDVRTAELRADVPATHLVLGSGRLALTIGYDATFVSNFADGFAFSGENVALRLPDGTTVGPIQDGRSQSVELLRPRGTARDLISRFEIDDPAAGTYAFLVRNGEAEAEVEFTIE
jgi:hypothetical protein